MGKRLVIIDANFAQNAIQPNIVTHLLKDTLTTDGYYSLNEGAISIKSSQNYKCGIISLANVTEITTIATTGSINIHFLSSSDPSDYISSYPTPVSIGLVTAYTSDFPSGATHAAVTCMIKETTQYDFDVDDQLYKVEE